MGIVRKMRFIETLREGERISEVYLCRHKQTAMTKAGKPYDSLTLQDKTGTLDAKIWMYLLMVSRSLILWIIFMSWAT